MASYVNQEYIPNPVRQDENFNLLATIGQMKQGQYNAAKQELQQAFDLASSVDILRPEDQQLLTERLAQTAEYINNYSNRNLTEGNVQATLMNSIRTVINEPQVQQAVVETAKFRNFQKEIATKREKNPELYSDVNYTDALEQAGFQEYISGVSNKMGEFRYLDYTDVNAKLNKEAKEYSDLLGKEQLLDTTSGEYYVVDTYGKRVNVNDIYSHLNSIMTPQDAEQLNINARQTLGKAAPQELKSQLNPYITNKIINQKNIKSALEAQLASESDENKKASLKLQLSNIDDQINNYQSEIDTGRYNIYSLYKQNMLESISSDYAIDTITGVKRDDMPFQVMKFEAEQLDRELTRQEKEQKARLQASQTLPTIVETVNNTVDELPADETVLRRSLTSADQALDVYLKSTNENNYNQKTPNEQWNYKVNLKSDDPTADTYSVERQNLIRNFTTVQKNYGRIISENTQNYISNVGEAFNSITGANLNNLSKELPISAYYLQQGKKFEDLDKNVQKAVALEMGNNWVLRGNSSEREVKVLQSTLNSLDAQLSNHPSQKVQNLRQAVVVKQKGDIKPNSGFQFGTYTSLYNLSRKVGNLFTQDTDLTEIERYTGDANKDFVEFFGNTVKSLQQNATRKAAEVNPNLVSNKSFSFSTENPNQKADALEIQAAILSADSSTLPNNENTYVITKSMEGFNVGFYTGTGKNREYKTVAVPNLSESLEQKIDLSVDNWYKSYENPNITLPQYVFTPKNREEANTKLANFAQNRPDVLPYETFIGIYNSGTLKGTPFQSDEDFFESAIENDRYSETLRPAIQNVLMATYTPTFKVSNGRLTASIKVTYPDGTNDVRLMVSKTKELDEGKLYAEVLTEIGNYKKQKIDRILGVK
jgi:hypothetical protein